MSKEVNHVHKLKRHAYKTTGSRIFHCTLPDCYFKIEVPLALGKKTICWRCGEVTEINEYSIRSAKPICFSCIKKRGKGKTNANSTRRNDRQELRVGKQTETNSTETLPAVKDYSLDEMREVLNLGEDEDL